jgi:hypothetical protein
MTYYLDQEHWRRKNHWPDVRVLVRDLGSSQAQFVFSDVSLNRIKPIDLFYELLQMVLPCLKRGQGDRYWGLSYSLDGEGTRATNTDGPLPYSKIRYEGPSGRDLFSKIYVAFDNPIPADLSHQMARIIVTHRHSTPRGARYTFGMKTCHEVTEYWV